jgi:alcohol dehydrogenase class IV
MEHPVSGLRNVVHGKGLAALAPHVYEASITGAAGKFAMLSRLLGGRDEQDFTKRIKALLEKINLTVTLGEMGVEEKDVDWLADNCRKVSAPSIANHPVVFGIEEIKEIYKKAI